MKFVVFTLSLLLCFTNLKAQNCNGSFTFQNQTEVDDFVAQYSSCKKINSLTLSNELDYTAFTFIDSINTLNVISYNGMDVEGLENVVHVEDLYLDGFADIDNLDLLDIQSIGSSIYLKKVALNECLFLSNLTEIPELSLSQIVDLGINIPFSALQKITKLSINSLQVGIPDFPSLTVADEIKISNSSTSNSLDEFSALDTINKFFHINNINNITSLSGISSIQYINDVTVLYNENLVNIDLSAFANILSLTIGGPYLTSITLPQNGIKSFSSLNSSITDFSFLNTSNSLANLIIIGNELNDFQDFSNLTIDDAIIIKNLPNITSLDGLNLNPTLDYVEVDNLDNLTDIQELFSVTSVNFALRVRHNSSLDLCCELLDLVDLANPNQIVQIEDNGVGCGSFEEIQSSCIDTDGDDVFDYIDNCINTANQDQQDSDEDGQGDVCDNCAIPINISLTTQNEVDSFFINTNYEECVIQDLTIEGNNDIFDLRPLIGINKVIGNLHIRETSNLQSLDGLDSLTEVGGNIELFNLASLNDIKGLKSVDFVGGNVLIQNIDIISSLEGLENIETIGGNITLQFNSTLSNCCAIEPFANINSGYSGTIIIGNNAAGCDDITEVQTVCIDSDGDEFLDIEDNCPNIRNYRQDDFDEDGVGDVCDNCPKKYNPVQGNQDNDTYGDACDLCPLTPDVNNLDNNNNGIGDVCENDAGPENGFIGIGINNPNAKVEVNDGDVFVNNIHRGVILQSPDGNCYKIKVQNDGSLTTIPMTCPQ